MGSKSAYVVPGLWLLTVSPMLTRYHLDPENLTGLYPTLRSFNAGGTITF